MSRGGPRTGKPGQSYANRTDLNAKALPATAVPGQPYGVAGAQLASQKIVPMANGPLPTQQVTPQPPQPQQSTPLASLFAPSQIPNQPVTHGVANSPGAGPEALNIQDPIVGQYQTAKTLIQQMASAPDASPALQFLAQRVNGVY